MDHTTAVTALDPTCSQPSDQPSTQQTSSPESTPGRPSDDQSANPGADEAPDASVDEYEHPHWARGQTCPACGSDEIGGVDIQSNAYIATDRALTRSKDGQVLAELVNWCRDCNELLYKHPLAEKLGLSPTSTDIDTDQPANAGANSSTAAESPSSTGSARDSQPASSDSERRDEQSQWGGGGEAAVEQGSDDRECWPPSDPHLEEENSSDRDVDTIGMDAVDAGTDAGADSETDGEEIPETLPDEWM